MKTSPAKLGFYCPGTGTGGPWRYVHSILAGLDPAEFDTTLFCDLPGGYEARPWVKVVRLDGSEAIAGAGQAVAVDEAAPAAPSRFVRLAPGAARRWAGFGQQSRRIARLLRRHPVDLFHTQNTGCEESPVAAKLAGIRNVVGTFHVDSTYDLHRERSGPSHRLLEAISNRCLDTAIAVSRATKKDWVRRSHVPAGRVETIHNGIDPTKFRRRQTPESARRKLGLPAGGLIVGAVGRLDEAKGFADLIDAVALLRRGFPEVFLAIAGHGPLRLPLEEKAARLGLSDRVRFLGFVDDVQPVLDSLDLFVLPSLCETLGYALLEAMATELPAVGSRVGGIPEVIAPGETGILVPPREPIRLAEGLRALLNDPDLRARMGGAGRRRVVRDFQERDMVRTTIEVYRNALRSAGSTRTTR